MLRTPKRCAPLALLLFAAGPAEAQTLAVEHVRVIPMIGGSAEDERALEDRTVVVRDGGITEVGPSSEVSIPEDANRIDGSGQTLIPGLADMHAHLMSDDRISSDFAPSELELAVANGLTTMRIMVGTPETLQLRDRIYSGELVAPILSVGSPQLAYRDFGFVFNGRKVREPEEARAAVAEFAAAGYEFLMITWGLRPEVYEAAAAAASEFGLRVVGQVSSQTGLDRALAAGQCIEHLDQYVEVLLPDDIPDSQGLSGNGVWSPRAWEHILKYDEVRLPQLVEKVLEAGVWTTPTMIFNEGFLSERTEEDRLSSPEYRFFSGPVAEHFDGASHRFWDRAQPEEYERKRLGALRRAIVGALHEAGAPMMVGTDSPNWGHLAGFSLARELEHLVEAGISPWSALEMATRLPAVWLGVQNEVGTIEVGKRADLVLLGANPLEDVGTVREVEGVVLRGRWLDRDELDGMLDRAEERLQTARMRVGKRKQR